MMTFRIASCNLLNFIIPGVRIAGRAGPDGDPIASSTYAAKVAWLSTLFEGARVDLVGLQELFHKEALRDLVAATPRFSDAHVYAPDLDHNVTADEARGPFCGVVSRFSILAQRAILSFPHEIAGRFRWQQGDCATDAVDVKVHEFHRPVLRVDVQLREDVTAIVFVAHLKSQRGELLDGEDPTDPVVQALGQARSLMIRAAEAAALRTLIVQAGAGNAHPIIVLGDLNDSLSAVTTQIIAGPDPFGELAGRPLATEHRWLYSVHEVQRRETRGHLPYSHIHRGRYDLLDHIFVSQELVGSHPGTSRPCATRASTLTTCSTRDGWSMATEAPMRAPTTVFRSPRSSGWATSASPSVTYDVRGRCRSRSPASMRTRLRMNGDLATERAVILPTLVGFERLCSVGQQVQMT